uniref:Uncharacterized protein n=1 Tax=Anguilla anguilla TaxID=7936 RepID=A0A0E9PL92_ANGAN
MFTVQTGSEQGLIKRQCSAANILLDQRYVKRMFSIIV